MKYLVCLLLSEEEQKQHLSDYKNSKTCTSCPCPNELEDEEVTVITKHTGCPLVTGAWRFMDED